MSNFQHGCLGPGGRPPVLLLQYGSSQRARTRTHVRAHTAGCKGRFHHICSDALLTSSRQTDWYVHMRPHTHTHTHT